MGIRSHGHRVKLHLQQGSRASWLVVVERHAVSRRCEDVAIIIGEVPAAYGSTEELLGVALVVDTTGRGSRAPVWLEALGYQRPADALGGDVASLVAPTPAHPRGGG